MKVEMRRALSILLMAFFSLGPPTAALQADDDSRLPACCRRHGQHHCAMSEPTALAAALATSTQVPAFAAPAHCPNFPEYLAQSMASFTALAPASAALPTALVQAHAPSPIRASVRFGSIREHLGRGPPHFMKLG